MLIYFIFWDVLECFFSLFKTMYKTVQNVLSVQMYKNKEY